MAGKRYLTLKVIADTAKYERDMRKAADASARFGRDVSPASRGLDLLKTAAIGGAIAVGGGLVMAFKSAISEANEHAVALAQTEAAIKSTGGVANVTADHLTKMADKLEKLTGIDDLAIQAGENLLLTFTNVRNEVGEGNNVFDLATQAALDMSVALGQDMTNSSMQLGKALNDPIKGLGALRRVGVQFTDAQKEQIEQMVKAGDTMGAQKAILAELTKEFGGSAEAIGKTVPGQIAILKARFGDLMQQIGEKLVPALASVVKFVSDHWPTISKVISTVMDSVVRIVKTAIEIGEAFWRRWGDTITGVIETVRPLVVNALGIVRDTFQLIANLLRGDWSGAWREFKEVVLGVVRGIWLGLGAMGELVWKAAKGLGGSFIGGIREGLASLGTVLYELIKAPLNAVIDAWNKIGIKMDPVKFLGKTIVPGIDVQVPQIPRLAAGGIVTQPTYAMIGEAGPEAVIPLNRMGGIGQTVIVNVAGSVVTERELTYAIRRELIALGQSGASSTVITRSRTGL